MRNTPIIRAFTALFACAVLSIGLQAAGVSYPIRVSENGHHFVDGKGQPFFYHADTGTRLAMRPFIFSKPIGRRRSMRPAPTTWLT